MIKKEVVFLLLFLFTYSVLFAQLDSITYFKGEIAAIKETKGFTPRDTLYIELINKLCDKYRHVKTDTIGVLANEALELSKNINYEKGVYEALSNLAAFELLNGNIEKSLAYNQEILKTLDIDKFPKLGANVYNTVGQTYFRMGNQPEAYTYISKSLLQAEKTDNKELIRKLNSNLGSLFLFLEDYDESLKFYKVALDGFDKDEESNTKAGILANIGYLHMKNKASGKSLEFLNKSLTILEKTQSNELLNQVYLAYGIVYYEIDSFDKALSYFERANSFYVNSNDIVNKALSFYGLGRTNMATLNFEKADEQLNLSLNLYKSVNFKPGLEEAYLALYELSKKQEQTAKALSFLELSEMYADSNYLAKNIRDITMLKTKMAFEEDKADLELKNDLEVAEQKKYVQRAIFGLLCALVIALLVIQSNRTEKKLNKELAIQTNVLVQKQEELNEINKNQDKLFSIVGHDLRGPIVSLKQLLALALEDETGIKHFYRFGPKLKKDVDHIHFTLDNLLNWGLTQMQGEPLKPVALNVKEELVKILDLFREVMDKKTLTVHKDLVENDWITIDANHFKIIFRNLISNAIKFTQATGEIVLKIQKEENKLIISIEDNGIGMSVETLSRIFKQSEFYTTFGTDNERGTGLGLTLCKEMVAKNKGTISVTSTLGKGSAFYVTFPSNN